MFERFTDRARRAVVLSQEEARELNHARIGTEHLLLGLLNEGEGVAARVLDTAGLTLDRARDRVREVSPPGDEGPHGNIPFTAHAKKALENSLREALQLGHSYIGTEHILLGLLRESEGAGAKIVEAVPGGAERMRTSVLTMLRDVTGPPPSHARGEPSSTEEVWAQVQAVWDVVRALEERVAGLERRLSGDV